MRVRNIFPLAASTYSGNLYQTGADEPIDRYDFENWSSLRLDSGVDATGRSPLKVIEVRVTFTGGGVKGVEVQDLNLAVMPIAPATGM